MMNGNTGSASRFAESPGSASIIVSRSIKENL
jgi:hypothetical protein